MEYKDPGRYIPIIYLLYSWGSRFGVPSRVPLQECVYMFRCFAKYSSIENNSNMQTGELFWACAPRPTLQKGCIGLMFVVELYF